MAARWSKVTIANASGGAEVVNVAINSTLTTEAINIEGANRFKLEVQHTNSTATAVVITIEESEDDVTWVATQDLSSVSAGTATADDAKISKTVSADADFGCTFLAPSATYLRFKVDGTGAGASDTVTLTGHVQKD